MALPVALADKDCTGSASVSDSPIPVAPNSHGKVIERLLANDKPELNATDPATGMTAFMLAASLGHDDVVSLLLSKGAQQAHKDAALASAAAADQVDMIDGSGDSALIVAAGARHGSSPAGHGLDVGAGDRIGEQASGTQVLLQAGAKVIQARPDN